MLVSLQTPIPGVYSGGSLRSLHYPPSLPRDPAVKNADAEKKHRVCSLSLSVFLILCKGDILHLATYRGDEEPARRKLPFVEALIQMCNLLFEHHSELSPLLSPSFSLIPFSLLCSPTAQLTPKPFFPFAPPSITFFCLQLKNNLLPATPFLFL